MCSWLRIYTLHFYRPQAIEHFFFRLKNVYYFIKWSTTLTAMLAFSAQMFIRHYLFHKVDSIFIRMMHTEKFEYEKCATFGLLGSNLKAGWSSKEVERFDILKWLRHFWLLRNFGWHSRINQSMPKVVNVSL